MDEKPAFGRSDIFFPGVATDEAPPIARRHLHDELRERLRDVIISGELAPNAKVPEKDLCERFGVSRTPLREALKVLAHEGLVILNHNRGAMVSPLTVADLEETVPVTAQLEALAGELACARASDEEIAEIRVLHDEMAGHFRAGDVRRHLETNERIHERIAQAAHNATLAHLLRSVSGRLCRARFHTWGREERLGEAITEHEAITAALEARDGPRLRLLLRAHMERTLDRLRGAMLMGAGGGGAGKAGWSGEPRPV